MLLRSWIRGFYLNFWGFQMDTLIILSKCALVLFLLLNIYAAFAMNKRRVGFILETWKRFRVGMFFEIIGILFLLITAIVLLMAYVPILQYGWYNLFSANGGNILFTPILELSSSSFLALRLFVPAFFIALLIIIPFCAEWEEEIFRRGHSSWTSITKQSIKFGLVHLLVGIPLAAGIAIFIPGFYLGYKYRRAYLKNIVLLPEKEAVREAVCVSTSYHTMIDSVLIIYLIYMLVS